MIIPYGDDFKAFRNTNRSVVAGPTGWIISNNPSFLNHPNPYLYKGSCIDQNETNAPFGLTRKRLANLAHRWLFDLSPAQQAQIAGVAATIPITTEPGSPKFYTGFESFIFVNTFVTTAIGDFCGRSSWTFPPAPWTFDDSRRPGYPGFIYNPALTQAFTGFVSATILSGANGANCRSATMTLVQNANSNGSNIWVYCTAPYRSARAPWHNPMIRLCGKVGSPELEGGNPTYPPGTQKTIDFTEQWNKVIGWCRQGWSVDVGLRSNDTARAIYWPSPLFKTTITVG